MNKMRISNRQGKDCLWSGFVTLSAFLILAIDWIYKIVINPRPYWIFRYDPEMIYFYGGLNLLKGRLPGNVDNPGIPVHLLSAGLLYLTGYGPLEIDHFRMLGYIVAFILYIVVAFLLLRIVLRNLPAAIQIAGLWTYFMCPQALEYNNIWSPELFYFPVASLVLVAMWGGDWHKFSYGRIFTIGLMIGLCCSVKFLFLAFIPALLISLLFIPYINWIERLKLISFGTLGIIFGFIVATIAVAPLYYKMFSRLWSFASHKGVYGSGAFGIPDFKTITANLRSVLFSAKGWHLWIIASLSLLGVGIWRVIKSKNRMPKRIVFLTIFSITAFPISYVLAAKTPNMPLRYILPTGVIGLLVFAAAMRLMPPHWLKKLQIPIIILACVLIFKHINVDINSHKRRIYEGLKMRHQIETTIEKLNNDKTKATIIYSWRVPEPSLALRLGANEKQLRVIEDKFPWEGHYNPWLRKIYLPYKSSCWNYLVIRKDQITEFPEQLGPALATIGEYRIYDSTRSRLNGSSCKHEESSTN